MSTPTIVTRQCKPLPKMHTYVGVCCREWILATGIAGSCGLCGERPKYLRADDCSTCWMCGDVVDHATGHECALDDGS